MAICKQIECLGNLTKLAPPSRGIGLPAHLRVAHAGEIERHHVVIFREKRSDEGKATGVGEKAMCHKHFRLFPVAPAKVMRPGTVDLNITFFARHLEGRHKPFRQMRTIAGPDRVDVVGKISNLGQYVHFVKCSLLVGLSITKPRYSSFATSSQSAT